LGPHTPHPTPYTLPPRKTFCRKPYVNWRSSGPSIKLLFPDDEMKPYQKIPIRECGEPLVPIPADKFVIPSPHAYEKLGANYRGKSPYFLRQGVLNANFDF